MHVTMIGTGCAGPAYGACFADLGHDVVFPDRDAGKIERLIRVETPIVEPGLDQIGVGKP